MSGWPKEISVWSGLAGLYKCVMLLSSLVEVCVLMQVWHFVCFFFCVHVLQRVMHSVDLV